MTSNNAPRSPFRRLPRRQKSGADYDRANFQHELTMILQRAHSVAASPREQFSDGTPVYDAASMTVIRLAALTERAEFGPWLESLTAEEVAGIRAMNNIIVYAGYATVDDEVFWETVTERIPEIVERLQRH